MLYALLADQQALQADGRGTSGPRSTG